MESLQNTLVWNQNGASMERKLRQISEMGLTRTKHLEELPVEP